MKLLLLLFLLIAVVMAKEHWVFHLEEHVDPQTFAIEHNLKYVKSVLDFSVFEGDSHAFKRLHMNAAAMDNVIHSEKQELKKQYHRAFSIGRSTDPLYSSQWHLHPPNKFSVEINKVSLDGRGVTIGIVDDGLQFTHPDLAQNYRADCSWDFNSHRAQPMPTARDPHGTAAAGVAAAAMNNGHCGRGAAPKASLAGIRLIGGPAYDYTEAEALTYKNNEIDIYSCSWGPNDGGHDLVGPGTVTRQALYHGITNGRHGKGSIFVWAAGNGAQNKDNVNYDGYANNIYTIAIGAIGYDGERAYYSEKGAPLMAVVPSSGGSTGSSSKGIVTTDLTGHAGYKSGECTTDFGGTSSACPLAAGMIALVLQERPDLTWRDVQHIVAKAGEKIHPNDVDWSLPSGQGTAISHSHQYGFGLLRAPELLRVARKHKLVPAQKWLQSHKITAHAHEGSINGFFTKVPVTFPSGQTLQFVEHAMVYVRANYVYRGSLIVQLVSPSGVVSKLTEAHNDRHNGTFQWIYTSVRHWGESSQGPHGWTVQFKDAKGRAISSNKWLQVQVSITGY